MTAHELTDFLDWLRNDNSGIEAGDQQFIMAQDLLHTLVARGTWPEDKDEWRLLLAPVFCSSAAQQELFYDRFNQRFLPTPQSPEPGGSESHAPRPERRTRNLVASAIFLLVVAAMAAVFLPRWVGNNSDGKRIENALVTNTTSAKSNRVAFKPLLVAEFMGLMLLPLCAALLLRHRRRQLELRKWTTPVEPRMRKLGLSAGTASLFAGADIRRLAIGLRRRRAQDSFEIDPDRTVEATARNGGYFTPVAAKRTAEPEYLWLGERKNLRDHKARLDDEVISRLRDNDVVVQRYYFQSNPRILSDARSEVFTLSELAAMHPHHEAWLQLDPSRCVDPVSGEPEKWWSTVHTWQSRVLFSFEAAAASLEVRVVQPTLRGLGSLASDQPQAREAFGAFPSVVKDHPESWLAGTEPPPAAVTRLMAQLRQYLKADGFLLLQACAVYPVIAWNITVTLAGELLAKGTPEPAISRLSMLPWFRHGSMPDWLRLRLVSRLGEEEERVRAALLKYLESSTAAVREKEEALDIVPSRVPAEQGQGQLQDYVYLSFVRGRRLDRLAVEAPEEWRRYLRTAGQSGPGLVRQPFARMWDSFLRESERMQSRGRDAYVHARRVWVKLRREYLPMLAVPFVLLAVEYSNRINERALRRLARHEAEANPASSEVTESLEIGWSADEPSPPLSQVQRVTNTVIAPSKTFTDILRSASWWSPWLLSVLMTLLVVLAIQEKIGWEKTYINRLRPETVHQIVNLPEEQQAKQIADGAAVTKYAMWAGPVIAITYALIAARVLLTSLKVGAGSRATLMQMVAVWMYATIPWSIESAVGIIRICAAVNPDSFKINNFVGSTLGYYLPTDWPKWVIALGTAMDIFTMWTLVLLTIGCAIVGRVKRGKAAAVVWGWWLLLTLFKVGAAALN